MIAGQIKVEAWGGHVTVTFLQEVPSSVLPDPRVPPPAPDVVYESELVEEPCWLMQLLGDSLEGRIERAKRKVAARAEEQLRRRQRANQAAREAAT